eukprot:9096413-Pyramimonas_sp.AAC.1
MASLPGGPRAAVVVVVAVSPLQSTCRVRMGNLPKASPASLPLGPILSDFRWPTPFEKRSHGPPRPFASSPRILITR